MIANERVQYGLFSLQHESIKETEQKLKKDERSPMSQIWLLAWVSSAWSVLLVIACMELQVD